MECPMCYRSFPADSIEAHAAACTGPHDLGEDTPAFTYTIQPDTSSAHSPPPRHIILTDKKSILYLTRKNTHASDLLVTFPLHYVHVVKARLLLRFHLF